MKKVLAMLILGCVFLAGPSMIFSAEPQVISAQDLHRAASVDPRAAEAQYLNKTVLVTGIVVSKGMSRYLTPNVVLSASEGGSELVICVLPRRDAGKLSDFEPGQRVTFSGRVHRIGERIVMKECTVRANN